MISYRPIAREDREEYLAMSAAFYDSEAVDHPIPPSYREATFEELMTRDSYAGGYILEYNGETAGYALTAKTFSQEAGGLTVWIEELYVKESYRSCGIGRFFLEMFTSFLPPQIKRVRLEVEEENTAAVALYTSLGFTFLRYDQMILERDSQEDDVL